MHDATCIGYLINPQGIKTQDMYVEVDVNSGPCYGRTVCDELGVLGKAPNTKVGITIDTDWFWGFSRRVRADVPLIRFVPGVRNIPHRLIYPSSFKRLC